MDDEKLLHPNLLQNCELIMLIRERQLTDSLLNIDKLSRNELMEFFRKHIMPKPQRKHRSDTASSNESASLSKEVKRIKLNNQPMDCTPSSPVTSQYKRAFESPPAFNKRRKIQWP